ncbi:hypothetical protein HDU92_002334, partial [Lobulomyces angularis]
EEKSDFTIYEDEFSILVPSYSKRKDTLKKFLDYYATKSTLELLPQLKKIFVIWIDEVNSQPPLDMIKEKSYSIPIEFVSVPEKSLNYRYRAPASLSTDAVMTIDDDVRIPLRSLEFLFQVYKNFPDRLVGLVNRPLLKYVTSSEPNKIKYYYEWSHKSEYYSLVLTGASFLHRNWLEKYWSDDSKLVKSRELVNKNFNGEDLSMNFMVSHFNGLKGPIHVETPEPWKMDGSVKTAISAAGDHAKKRTEMLSSLSEVYGYMNCLRYKRN